MNPGEERTENTTHIRKKVSCFGGSDFCHGHVALQVKATSSDTSLPAIVVRSSLSQATIQLQQRPTHALQGVLSVLIHVRVLT